MKCDLCGKKTYTIHIDENHDKVCAEDCYESEKETKRVCEKDWSTDPARYR